MEYSLTAEATAQDFVFISDVAPHAGGGGEGALTFVAGKLLQRLNTQTFTRGVLLVSFSG